MQLFKHKRTPEELVSKACHAFEDVSAGGANSKLVRPVRSIFPCTALKSLLPHAARLFVGVSSSQCVAHKTIPLAPCRHGSRPAQPYVIFQAACLNSLRLTALIYPSRHVKGGPAETTVPNTAVGATSVDACAWNARACSALRCCIPGFRRQMRTFQGTCER